MSNGISNRSDELFRIRRVYDRRVEHERNVVYARPQVLSGTTSISVPLERSNSPPERSAILCSTAPCRR
jgi:hypothetical protein